MKRSNASYKGSPFGAVVPPAVLVAGAALLVSAAAASAQGMDCRGLRTCASVEVAVVNDQLLVYAPNAVPGSHSPVGSEERGGSRSSVPSGAERSGPSGVTTLAPSGLSATPPPPVRAQCEEFDRPARGFRGGPLDEDDDCGPAGLYLVALPLGVYLLGPGDGGSDGADIELPGESGEGPGEEGDTGNSGEDSGEDGSDDTSGGTSGGDSGGTSGGDSGGTSGGDSGGTSGGDSGGTSGGDSGGTSGGDSGGTSGGDSGGGGGPPWEGSGHTPTSPPMSEVPEPVTTTLLGLGLAGYAAARLRGARREEGDIRA